MKNKFKMGDLVTQRYVRPSLFGLVMKVHKTKTDSNEYSVSWLQDKAYTRCTEGALEIVSKV
jgi:hypothetical protein